MSVHLAKGMRDILPAELRKRRFIIERIQRVFESFGFEPLQTPAVERIETLMGKYGDEGNKLIFRILARGKAGEQGKADSALRYDLTVPLARVVAMNPQLSLPLKDIRFNLSGGQIDRNAVDFESFINVMWMWLGQKCPCGSGVCCHSPSSTGGVGVYRF